MGVLSADHIRVFLAVIEKGSFSAAARFLRRSQTAISYAILNLEEQLGVQLFERSGRIPVLTAAGSALIVDAQKVTHSLHNLRSRADAISRGLEPEIAVAIDAYFPTSALVAPMREFATLFPHVRVAWHREMVGTALQMVLDERCVLGIVSQAVSQRPDVRQIPIGQTVRLAAVVAPDHPLARELAPISGDMLASYIQISSDLNLDIDIGSLSPQQWQCSDLPMMHAAAIASVGWSMLPEEIVAGDIDAGRLVRLRVAAWPNPYMTEFSLNLVHLPDTYLGPAARWLCKWFAASPDIAPGER